jgi:hypothetical protein
MFNRFISVAALNSFNANGLTEVGAALIGVIVAVGMAGVALGRFVAVGNGVLVDVGGDMTVSVIVFAISGCSVAETQPARNSTMTIAI